MTAARLRRQLADHTPIQGVCPLCGVPICSPRLAAVCLLEDPAVERTLTDDEQDALALLRFYRKHRDVDGECQIDGVPNCELGQVALWGAAATVAGAAVAAAGGPDRSVEFGGHPIGRIPGPGLDHGRGGRRAGSGHGLAT